jgi:glucose/arabinose dehydrogenase
MANCRPFQRASRSRPSRPISRSRARYSSCPTAISWSPKARAAMRRSSRPKDVIAGYIKSLGKSSVKGGDRITLLRDAERRRQARAAHDLHQGSRCALWLALVNGSLYVANQGALLRFAYSDGQTSIAGKGEEVTKLPSADQPSLDQVARREPRWQQALCRHRLEQQYWRTRPQPRGRSRGDLGDRSRDQSDRIYVSGIRNPPRSPSSRLEHAVGGGQ